MSVHMFIKHLLHLPGKIYSPPLPIKSYMASMECISPDLECLCKWKPVVKQTNKQTTALKYITDGKVYDVSIMVMKMVLVFFEEDNENGT
jgi:hypothetical protein